jgi:hypothetical protein
VDENAAIGWGWRIRGFLDFVKSRFCVATNLFSFPCCFSFIIDANTVLIVVTICCPDYKVSYSHSYNIVQVLVRNSAAVAMSLIPLIT